MKQQFETLPVFFRIESLVILLFPTFSGLLFFALPETRILSLVWLCRGHCHSSPITAFPVLFLSLSRLCFCKVLISYRGSGSNPRTPWQPDNAREYEARVPTCFLILLPIALLQGTPFVHNYDRFNCSLQLIRLCGLGACVHICALAFGNHPVSWAGVCLCLPRLVATVLLSVKAK